VIEPNASAQAITPSALSGTAQEQLEASAASRELVEQTALPVRGGVAHLALRVTLSLGIAACLFWILRSGGLPVVPSQAAWARVDAVTLLVFGLLTLLSVHLRTYRWVYLLRPIDPHVSVRQVYAVGLLGFAALFAPMRMGELARPLLISRNGRISFVQGLGTVIAERIVDGTTLSLFLGLCLLLATPVTPFPDHLGDLQLPVALVPRVTLVALLVFLSAFTGMAACYFWRDITHRLVHRVLSMVSVRLADRVTEQLERASDSFSFLLSRQHGIAFLRDTLLYWLVSGLSFQWLLRGAGAPADLAQAFVVLGVLGLGTALPGPPGFYGMYQIGCYCGIAMFFPDALLTSGAVFTFVSYASQLLSAGLALLIGFCMLGTSNTNWPKD